jgi:hypothetical protein
MAVKTRIDASSESGVELRGAPSLESPRFQGVMVYTSEPRRARQPERGYKAPVLCIGSVHAVDGDGFFSTVHDGVYHGDLIIPDGEKLYKHDRYLVNLRKLEGDDLSIYGGGDSTLANLRRRAERGGGRWKPAAAGA